MGLQRSKYKKVILAVFPIDTNGDIQMHNMGKLVHFCELTPQKLPKVANFLEKRVDSDLYKGRLGYVEVSMKIFNELIKGCRKHLPLFAGSLVKLMKLLFEKSEYPALKIIATETFTRFADVQDEATQYSGIEDFVNYFVGMCRSENSDTQTQTRLRIAGLRGLRAYIVILDYADELDSFVSKQSQARIIPTILDNMQYEAVEGQREPENMNNVSNLATEVLKDLSSRVNNITVTAVVSAVLNYLDAHNRWVPNTFAIHCLQTISFSLKPQHNQIMMTRVLQHLESTHTIQVTMQIVEAITAIVSESTGPVTVVLSSLVKLLVLSVEQSAQTPPPPNLEEHLALQTTIVECVGAISKKFPTGGQKMDAMGYMLAQCEEVRLRAGSVTLALVLAQCVLAVGGNLLPADGALVPGAVVSALMELAANADPQVRVLAQKTIHCTLLPGHSLEQLSVTGSAGDEFPLSRYSPAIREAIYNTTLMKTNQPENLVTIYHTLAILLLRARAKELPDSIQLVFKLQHKASKKRFPTLPGRSIHTMIAAYLLQVAKVYESIPLSQYVAEIQAKREAEKQTCRYIEVKSDHSLVTLSVKKPKYSESAKHRTVTVFFDREVVVDLLCGIPLLSKEYGKTLRRALSKKYNTNRGKRAHSSTPSVTSPPANDPFSRPALSAVSPPPPEDKKEEITEVPIPLLLNHNAPKLLTVEALRKALAQHNPTLHSDSHPQIPSIQSVSLLLTTQYDYQTTATQCSDAVNTRAEVLSYLKQPALPHDYDPASFEHFWAVDEDPADAGEEVINVEDFDVCAFSPLSLDLKHPLLAH
eukprot:Phypoly_transcript_00984.p1 GENE.Phypoly_transcript_00984~~Phypoly_transcript_00984.p1  ORF type:complete len:857 (-),score=157.30 Phypoly_transcript_00984:1255-3699(-)